MKKIDVRFSASEMAEIQKMVGKKMVKYKCDPFEFSTSVYGIVGVSFEDGDYAFTNMTEVMDYYGEQEDVALFKLVQKPFSSIRSLIQNQSMIETPVESTVSEVLVVNENQQLFENGKQIYEVSLTRGIIFIFEDEHELSFEKNIWFSEDITVEKGYKLLERFTPKTEFTEGWSGNYCGVCSREIVSVK
ncbi:MAG: hypothetical protein Q4B85_12785 [Lachnospiraceae bacterium]|nr:hypothetical protein [Lachnospiraceae bacterium]